MKLCKHQTCYVFWLSDGFIDLRKAKIIDYTSREGKMSTTYKYTLLLYTIDYYEMYKDSPTTGELRDPSFTRNESEIYETFEEATLATLELMIHHAQRMTSILTYEG